MLFALIKYSSKHCACRHIGHVSALSSDYFVRHLLASWLLKCWTSSTLRRRNLKTQLYFHFGNDNATTDLRSPCASFLQTRFQNDR